MSFSFDTTRYFAEQTDANDPLRAFRDRFHLPVQPNGQPYLYFCGNSLGLQPKTAQGYIDQELKDWATLGVEGHFHAQHPWMPYHELLTGSMADLVGAKPLEVVIMNTLSVNLHLMMASFYRPTPTRFKILIESDAFPSDRYAVASQAHFHGYDPQQAILNWRPRPSETLLRMEDLEDLLAREGESIALVLLGGVNYYTGQAFDLKKITALGHGYGCRVGFDLAHAAGNIPLHLHEDGPDFAAWCTYKYLNSGPGSVAACFVHERHANAFELPRFAGWWGHNKNTRFNMRYDFDPMPGAEGWQLSNPPILSLAAIRASLDVFAASGMPALRQKSLSLTAYLEYLLQNLGNSRIRVVTPAEPEQRGCQLSIQVLDADKALYQSIGAAGIVADWREPDVIRVAPTPLYNTYVEVFEFVERLQALLAK